MPKNKSKYDKIWIEVDLLNIVSTKHYFWKSMMAANLIYWY
jgi:hypothetical protein